LSGKGVLVDFSTPEGTKTALRGAVKAGWGLVVGTTGLDDQTMEKIKTAATKVPIVRSSNMSVGVNLLLDLVATAAKKLPDDFKIKIFEAHHVHKKDAPSGTALMVKGAVAAARGWDKKRADQEIGMDVKREGEIIGDHTVFFTGPAETIEIAHHALSRDTFARGALAAAFFLSTKGKGLYSMADVLK
jgi:4-hydroxy-tetrahydrodipicolinate reductase